MLCRIGTVKRLSVYHYSADSIFWYIGISGPVLSQFENRGLLKPVLGVSWMRSLLSEDLRSVYILYSKAVCRLNRTIFYRAYWNDRFRYAPFFG